MNKKGSMGQVGVIIMIFITALVGLILLVPSAQNVGEVTNTYAVANESTVSTNGTTGIIDTDCQAWTGVVVYNGSDDVIVTSGNYTVTNNFVSNGAQTTRFNVSANPVSLQAQPWNVSYTCAPTTYDNSSGGRSMASLIVILFALAIAVAVITKSLDIKVIDMLRGV